MPPGPRFGSPGDVIGCGFSAAAKCAFFTLNGIELPPTYLPEWFTYALLGDAPGSSEGVDPNSYMSAVRPCVVMEKGTRIKMNFGHESFACARMESQRCGALVAAAYR